eukprot:1186663-Pleurochrysis_carterae.AAC.1
MRRRLQAGQTDDRAQIKRRVLPTKDSDAMPCARTRKISPLCMGYSYFSLRKWFILRASDAQMPLSIYSTRYFCLLISSRLSDRRSSPTASEAFDYYMTKRNIQKCSLYLYNAEEKRGGGLGSWFTSWDAFLPYR